MWPEIEEGYENPAHCALCGAPIFERDGPTYNGYPEEPGWLADAVLLRPLNRYDPDSLITEKKAESKEGLKFQLSDSGELIEAFRRPRKRASWPLHLPCHPQCVSIAKRVISLTANTSMAQLWSNLRAQFDREHHDFQPLWCDLCPLAGRALGRRIGEIDEKMNIGQIYGALPTAIPSLTDNVLSHLQVLPLQATHLMSPTSDEGLASFIARLPPEISSAIMLKLSPLHDISLECTFVVPPTYWLQGLSAGLLLPWLWDLDALAIQEKESSKPWGHEWNWELLVRQLAQMYASNSPKGIWATEDLPLGLRNRKRIWEHVEDLLKTKAEWGPPDTYGMYLKTIRDECDRCS